MTNVLAVDDERIIHELFSLYISAAADRYRLVAAIKDAASAQLYCAQSDVGLVLMDICTANNESGIAATAVIKKKYPHVKVIIVTGVPDYRFIEKAREAGADSFCYKEAGTEELLSIMDRTIAGESVYPASSPVVKIGLASSKDLTKKEIETLQYVVQGKSLSEIADLMGVDYSTVKWHIRNLKGKTGAKSIAALAVMAVRAKLILPEY